MTTDATPEVQSQPAAAPAPAEPAHGIQDNVVADVVTQMLQEQEASGDEEGEQENALQGELQEEGQKRKEEEVKPEPAPEPAEQQQQQQLSYSEMIARMTAYDRENRHLKQQVKAFQQSGGNLQQLQQLAKQNPVTALQQLGLSVDDVFDHYLQGQPQQQAGEQSQQQQVSPEHLAQLKEMKERLEAFEKQREQDLQVRQEENYLSNIGNMISRADVGDRWQLLNAFKEPGSLGEEGDSRTLILNTAAEIYRRTEQPPNLEQVADFCEEYLLEAERARRDRYSQFGKIAQLYGSTNPPPVAAEAAPQQSPPPTGGRQVPRPAAPDANAGARIPDVSTPRAPSPRDEVYDEEEALRKATRILEEADERAAKDWAQ